MALAKRLIPLLSIFVLLLCSLPFDFASAADYSTNDVSDSSWYFEETLAFDSISSLSDIAGGEVSFYTTLRDGSLALCKDIEVSPSYIMYLMDDGRYIGAWSTSGWAAESLRTITITDAPASSALYNWLTRYASVTRWNGSTVPGTTYVIDGQSFLFSTPPGDGTSFTLRVTEGGVIFVGYHLRRWVKPTGTTFIGLSTVDDNTPEYPAGTNFTFDPGEGGYDRVITLYPCYHIEQTGVTRIQVYNNAGDALAYSNSFSSSTAINPELELRVVENGFHVYANGTYIDQYNVLVDNPNADKWLGFALSRNSPTVTYAPGATIRIGGENYPNYLSLYNVYEASTSVPPDLNVTEWLGRAVAGFLDFKIMPGLALSDILITILAIGMLFTFLKIAI